MKRPEGHEVLVLLPFVVLLSVMAGTSAAPVAQVGNRFPLGVQLGNGSDVVCTSPDADGLLRFYDQAVQVCRSDVWVDVGSNETLDINTELTSLRSRVDDLESGSSLPGNLENLETLMATSVCNGRGVYNAATRLCECDCDPLRGCWSTISLCTLCASGVSGTFCNVDQVAPVLTVLGDSPITVQAGSTYVDAGATASDNLDGDLTSSVVVDSSAVNTGALGTYQVQFSVSDSAGFTTTAVRSVVVDDSTPPTVEFIGQLVLTVEAGDGMPDDQFIVTDNLDVDVEQTANISETLLRTPGVYSPVVYVFTDDSGNSATSEQQFEVHVVDTTPPVLTLVGDSPYLVDKGSEFVDPGVTATDNAVGNVTVFASGVQAVNTSREGNYTIVYSGVDIAGNEAVNVSRIVEVDTFFVSHLFTTCGQSGATGPSATACRDEYRSTAPWADDDSRFDVVGGIQYFTVPSTGSYDIFVKGAEGGGGATGVAGGKGAILQGTFDLQAGDQLKLLVGQQGGRVSLSGADSNSFGGGGGGTFVALADNTPLIVAGGGAGSNTVTQGANGNTADGNGQGASGGSKCGAGSGFNSAGSTTSSCFPIGIGSAFVDGGIGGTGQCPDGNSLLPVSEQFGGFGGGGAPIDWSCNGGGGGYQGGNPYNGASDAANADSAGSSFIATSATKSVRFATTNDGHGSIYIRRVVPIQGFLVHTFTSCGQSGATGPSQTACREEYSLLTDWANDDSRFTVTNGIQYFTVPGAGTYRIRVEGAEGGAGAPSVPNGGGGAILEAAFDLPAGTQLKLLVGQKGGRVSLSGAQDNSFGGGGGGTFVALADNTPLIVAGGGAGSNTITQGANANTADGNGQGASGGSKCGAGSGFLSAGSTASSCFPIGIGSAFVDGGIGGTGQCPDGNSLLPTTEQFGGFGGGGAPIDWSCNGGGGGYQGGNPYNSGTDAALSDSAGWSYVNPVATDVVRYAETNQGHGSITIEVF